MLLIALIDMIAIFSILGCASTVLTIQPEIHPIAGASLMFVPEGCKIGDIETLENGIYIGESILIESMLQQRREGEAKKQRERQSRT